MEAMINASPSQEAFTELTKASSFHGFPGGDTQPMESQVYRDYTESMVRSNTTTPKKQLIKFHVSPDGKMTYETEAMDTSPKTCEEGDTGYVELEWDAQSQGEEVETQAADARYEEEAESSYVAELLEDATQLQVQGEARPSTMPETPSLAGQKHGRDGEVFTSSPTNKKTPGFTQLFGDGIKGATMTATQLFGQTQAPSSPFGDGPQSDPIITRPSPNVHQQFTASSPTWLTTSPAASRHIRHPSVAGEPREKYTSVRESQEHRAAKMRQELGLGDRFPEDIIEIEDEDEHHDSERRRFENKRMQRVMSDNALHGWQRVRAPSRPGSRPTSSPKPRTTIDLVTPGTEKRKDEVEFDVSDDGNATDDEMLAQPDTGADGHESVDEYDELGQTVLRSQGFEEQSEAEDEVDPRIEDEGDEADLGTAGITNSHPYHPPGGEFATQPSAIADSQPYAVLKAHTAIDRRSEARIPQSSLVPGSQYQGRMAVEQPHTKDGQTSTHDASPTLDDRVPSSPPVPHNTVLDMNTRAPKRKASLRESSSLPQISNAVGSSAFPLEVPESDIAMPDEPEQDWSGPRVTSNGDSNGYRLYSTAQTHVTVSGPLTNHKTASVSPFKAFASQQSRTTSQTPRTAAGVRHFADIANPVSSLRMSGESEDIDVEAIMSDIITADDQEVFDVMGSPTFGSATKRRQVMYSSDIAKSSPAKPVERKTTRRAQVVTTDETEEKSPPHPQPELARDDSSHVLQASPNKANKMPASTPSPDEIPDSTPDSVRKRETAGANAASKLLLRRTGRTPKPSTVGIASKAEVAKKAKKKGVEPRMEAEDEEVSAVIEKTVLEVAGSGEDMEMDHQQQPTAEHEAPAKELLPVVQAPIDRSKQVFALFKGSFNNFYPATWISTSPDGRNYRVRFEDGNVTELDTKHVRKFELRPGDVVKVDVTEMRSKTWVVGRLGGPTRTIDHGKEGSDADGYNTVHVQSKASRTSQATPATHEANEGTIEVSIDSIYLTHTMWVRFADREFVPPVLSAGVFTRPSTPSLGMQTPNADSPASRSRRAVIPTAKALGVRPTTLRDESVLSSTPLAAQGLFSGMAFAISYGSHEAEKAEVTRMITRNGGMILDNGFDELFVPPTLADPSSPSKKSGPAAALDSSEEAELQLEPECKSIGFVALIADKHSRRAKYVQALALGLPTLSGKWLTDSLDGSKNTTLSTPDATPLPWSKYLLPAGESAYLGGATRSRTMAIYPPGNAKLAETIESRDILLNGEGVLIVVPKRSKAVWERRKAYAFLTLALGACGVKRVSDLDEAKAYVDGEDSKWKWVYVEGSVADASKVLFAKSGDGGKKRKRDGTVSAPMTKVDAKATWAGDGKVRIVNDEFVIQSLILGALVD